MDKFVKDRARALLAELDGARPSSRLKIAATAIDQAYTDGFQDGHDEGLSDATAEEVE